MRQEGRRRWLQASEPARGAGLPSASRAPGGQAVAAVREVVEGLESHPAVTDLFPLRISAHSFSGPLLGKPLLVSCLFSTVDN